MNQLTLLTTLINKTRLASTLFATLAFTCLANTTSYAQQATENGSVQLMSSELDVKSLPYRGNRVLLHIRTGTERAVVFPEPVVPVLTNPTLPGCRIVVDIDVVGFYPTQTFERETIQVIGLETGTTYELGVRASPTGFLHPLRLTLPQ